MASRALQRCGLVKQNLLAGNLTRDCVTTVTFHVGVTTLERELSSLVVIKCRRHPSLYVVAVRAGRFSCFCSELTAMPVRMAFLAALGRSLELCLFRAG
jgi:hypothetical protein